jgi:hypothetical protein
MQRRYFSGRTAPDRVDRAVICGFMRTTVLLALGALACAPRRAEDPLAHYRTTPADMRAALAALPRCRPARVLPSVSAVKAERQHPDSCVTARGRLVQAVMRPCPAVVTAGNTSQANEDCVEGWMLWESSLPVPDRLGGGDWAHAIPLDFSPGGADCDPKVAGITEAARIAGLRRPGNGELEAAPGLPQPIVVVLGVVPRQSSLPGDYTVELQQLEVTHLCIADDAG